MIMRRCPRTTYDVVRDGGEADSTLVSVPSFYLMVVVGGKYYSLERMPSCVSSLFGGMFPPSRTSVLYHT